MKPHPSPGLPVSSATRRPRRWPWLLAVIAGLAVGFGLFKARKIREAVPADDATGEMSAPSLAAPSRPRTVSIPVTRSGATTAQEIVAARLEQFVRGRRELVHAMAQHLGIGVPADVEEFFKLAEAGRWIEAEALYRAMFAPHDGSEVSADVNRLRPAVLETIGVHEAVRDWPAQALLDYGNRVLDALPPGAVYLGGTDSGRFIPTLLNDSAGDGGRVVLTQNAFADLTYLDYIDFLYGGRITSLTADDSQRAFQDYMVDATHRLEHDEQFPAEPKQVRPGEDIQASGDGRVRVGGQVAVMAINERLLKALMERNPDVPFAMEESYPFASLYTEATPRGPVVDLRVGGEESALTPERAAETLDYWREATRQILADPETSGSTEARTAYAKLALAQAGLLQQHQFTGEAEQAFQMANELAPGNPEAVMRFVDLLAEQQRFADAIPVAEAALRLSPDNEEFRRGWTL